MHSTALLLLCALGLSSVVFAGDDVAAKVAELRLACASDVVAAFRLLDEVVARVAARPAITLVQLGGHLVELALISLRDV